MVAHDAIRFQFLEGVRKGVVSYVVKEGGVGDQVRTVPDIVGHIRSAAKDAERPHGQVVHAQSVIEARVGRTGIDQVRKAELADVTEPLKRRRVHNRDGDRIQPDRVPHRITNDERTSMPVHGRRQ